MKRPALYLLAPFCFGIIISRYIQIQIIYPIAISSCLVACAVLFSGKKILSHTALYLAVFFLGTALFYNSLQLPNNHIANLACLEPKKVLLRGVVIDDPSTFTLFKGTEKTSFTVKSEFIKDGGNWRKVTGLVKVDVYSQKGSNLYFADDVMLEGLIYSPASLKNPGIFDYAEYLKIKNIYALLKVRDLDMTQSLGRLPSSPVKRISYMVRRRIRKSVDSYMQAPYNSFIKAILIGERSELPNGVKEDFIKTGTVHILAISGLHVGLIGAVILAFLALLKIPRKINLALTLTALIFYSFIAGCNPPIIRAVIIFAMFVIGYLIARDTDMINSLSIAAFAILLWNPKELFDPSFQLSFVSVASIVIFVPKLDKILRVDNFQAGSLLQRSAKYLLKAVSVSVAAWAGTWPFIAAYFNIISPVAIIANLIVIPLLFIIMAGSLLFIAASLFSNFLSVLMANGLRFTEMFLFFMNHWLSALPFAYLRVPAPPILFSIIYYMIFAPRFKRAALAGLLIFLNIFIWWKVLSTPTERLTVTFFDVGQGDSALVELPDSGNILIDGGTGGSEDKFDAGKYVIAPCLWNKGIMKIDTVIVTHMHDDHLGGIIYILNNFKIGQVADNGEYDPSSRICGEYISIIKNKNIRHVVLKEGDTLNFTRGVKGYILNPPSENAGQSHFVGNDGSLVLKLVYKNFGILFCGDVTENAIARLNSYGDFLRSSIVKVPHHGANLGKIEVVEKFFENISPEISVISVGRNNQYNAPSKKTTDIITSLNSRSYETKDIGAMAFSVEQNGVIERWRKM